MGHSVLLGTQRGFSQTDSLPCDYFNLKLIEINIAFSRLDKEAMAIGLVQNEVKSKYFLASNKQSASPLSYDITVDSHYFDIVDNFVCLETIINTNNNVSREIQRKVSFAKRQFALDRKNLTL